MYLAVDNEDEDAELKAMVDASADLIEIDDIEADENDTLDQDSILFLLIYYRKIPNVSPGLIEVFKHFLGGLYSGGLIFGGHFVLVSKYQDLKIHCFIRQKRYFFRPRLPLFNL